MRLTRLVDANKKELLLDLKNVNNLKWLSKEHLHSSSLSNYLDLFLSLLIKTEKICCHKETWRNWRKLLER